MKQKGGKPPTDYLLDLLPVFVRFSAENLFELFPKLLFGRFNRLLKYEKVFLILAN